MTAVPYRAMSASLRSYWEEAEGYERLCYVVGTILVVVGLLHALVFVVLGGAWAGPVSWRKPATFGVSFGLTTLTLGWVAGHLRLGGAGWPLLGAVVAANTLEVIWVSFAVTVRRLPFDDIRAMPTTWAKKLALPAANACSLITARRTPGRLSTSTTSSTSTPMTTRRRRRRVGCDRWKAESDRGTLLAGALEAV